MAAADIYTAPSIPGGRRLSFFLSAFRDLEGAKSLFRRTLRTGAHRQRRVIHTDLAPTYDSAITALQYLNNIIEEEHPAIRKRVNAKQGFSAARRTIDCYGAVHRMRKESSPLAAGPRCPAADSLRRPVVRTLKIDHDIGEACRP